MEEELSKAKEELARLQDKLQRSDVAVKAAVVAIKTKNAAIEERDAKIGKLEDALRQSQETLRAQQARIAELERENRELKRKRPREEEVEVDSQPLASLPEPPTSSTSKPVMPEGKGGEDEDEAPPPKKKKAILNGKAPPPQPTLLPTPPTATTKPSMPPPLLPTPPAPVTATTGVKASKPSMRKRPGIVATIPTKSHGLWAPCELEPRQVQDSIQEEAMEIRGQIKPTAKSPNATYVNIVLRKHMRNPENKNLEIMYDLLTLDRRIGRSVVVEGLLTHFKSEVTTALSHSLNRIWPAPLSQSVMGDRITNRTITLLVRLSGKEAYGPLFLEKAVEDLSKQVVKLPLDVREGDPSNQLEEEEDEGGGGGGDPDGKSGIEVTKYEKHMHIMAMLLVLLCKRTQDMARIRCLVHDIVAVNLPSPGPVFALSSVARYWPEVLQGTNDPHQPNHVSRAIQSLLSEILGPICETASQQTTVDKHSVFATIYEDMCQDLGWPKEAPFSSEVVAEEAMTDLSMTEPPPREAHVAEAVRALELLACGRGREWVEGHLLSPRVLGARSINLVRMLATVGRQLVLQDAVEKTSSEMMRRLMLYYQDVVGAQGMEEEDKVKMWAVMGVLSLPGAPQGEIKQAMSWFDGLAEETQVTLPTPFYRKVLRASGRPHCCVVVRDSASARALDIQAILHDLSVHYIDTAVLSSRGVLRDLKRGRLSEVDPVTLQHLAVWHLYKAGRMEELDYTSGQPSEVVVLESDAVGVRSLGLELRALLEEVRQRKVPWDLLALSFMEDVDQHHAARRRHDKVELATSSCVVSSAGYIISKEGATSLLKRASQNMSIERLVMAEMTEADLRVLTPERELIHYDEGRYQAYLMGREERGRGGGR